MKKFAAVLMLLLMTAPVPAVQGENIENNFSISGRAVVFFGPTWDEYIALTDQDKDAIDEELYDFAHNRSVVRPYLEANGIRETFTSSENIRIQIDSGEVLTYFRSELNHIFGLIMTDGQNEPRVFLGAATPPELKSMFQAYFGLQ